MIDIKSISAFADYQVQIETGNCTVSKDNWNRHDFPFWKYFEEATTAESLNNWSAKGKDISERSDYAQKGANSIGDSQITILMPESLKKRMDEDEGYAEEIMRKVSKWKENYDKTDMAIGMSHGETGFQAASALKTGSYLIELDENGNVENYTVTTPGIEYSSTASPVEHKELVARILNKSGKSESLNLNIDNIESKEQESDYIVAMEMLSSLQQYNKK